MKAFAAWMVTLILTIVLVTPALAAKPVKGGGVSHKAKQTPPIQLGTSGGWRNDLANGYCCGGTLGSLVTRNNKQYILSNFHVFAGDVDDTDGTTSQIGYPIIQPGLIDVGCLATNAQNVATLSDWTDPLAPFNIDAAIAEVVDDMVRIDGSILEIGIISSSTRNASLNLTVKKSGRTTGLTRSKVSGLNATISVIYDNECAGEYRGIATFTGQIVISNRGSKFLAGGDSGSLMVEDVDPNPRAVGLLFAGSSSTAIANPIDDILNYFGATMVGNAASGFSSADAIDSAVEEAKKAQGRNATRLKRVPGGVGHAIGLGRDGKVVIKVYVENDTPEARAAVPDSVDGIPVEIEETGRIVAF